MRAQVRLTSDIRRSTSLASSRATPAGPQIPAHATPAHQRHSISDVAIDAPVLQPKLTIGAVDDPAEREADDVAERVMRMTEPAATPSPASVQLRRKCAACDEEGKA